MTLSTDERILIEQRVQNDGKSLAVAYILLFFLWFFSAHRFYLGRTSSAVLQFLLNIIIIGWVWVFIDIFLLPSMTRAENDTLRRSLEGGVGTAPSVDDVEIEAELAARKASR
ncbi:MAG: TM2 domain-containing protein [Pseudomonadota bacterium]